MRTSPFILACACGLASYTASAVLFDAEQKPLQKNLASAANPEFRIQFETPEHINIGNTISLQYQNQVISGRDFGFQVKGKSLSFGEVLAFAGDFYYRWTFGACEPSISTAWDASHAEGVKVGLSHVDTLRTERGFDINCIRDTIQAQADEVSEGLLKGRDPAQVYRSRARLDNGVLALCSLGYAVLSTCNWDHFGTDASKAYTALHTAALQQAAKANATRSDADLKEAYFIEAYAQHFLTDMFSAGHIRTPRRILHSSFDFNFQPGDFCTQRQHDEESAMGLWVTNGLNQSWAVYGDKQLNHGRSSKNMQYVVEASQSGIDEIWEVFKGGKQPAWESFKAILKAPIPESARNPGNFVPLFAYLKDPRKMAFRSNVDERTLDIGPIEITIPSQTQNDKWSKLLEDIDASGPKVNLYTFTKPFSSSTRILHLKTHGQRSDTVLANTYGDVDAGAYGKYWSMRAQVVSELPLESKRKIWSSVTAMGNGVYSLVGRVHRTSTTTSAYHVGLKVAEGDDGQARMETLWNSAVIDEHSDMTHEPGEVVYGVFGDDDSAKVMVKYYDLGSAKPSSVELWSTGESAGKNIIAPVKYTAAWNPSSLNFLLPHKVSPEDKYSTLVGYSYRTGTATWHFSTWKNNYTEQVLTTIPQPSTFPVQAILSDPASSRLIRIHYGNRFPVSQQLRIDIQQTSRSDHNGQVNVTAARVQDFQISWLGYLEENYQRWFLSDVNGDGTLDLVAYVTQGNNIQIHVVVFPGLADGTFGKPVTSAIRLDPEIGSLLVGEFLKPLYTKQAAYTYPGSSSSSSTGEEKTDAAILTFFDNYGIIGSRILAPKTARGTFEYEVKGQNPAIAGQRSTMLGFRPEKWMGRTQIKEAVGIVDFV